MAVHCERSEAIQRIDQAGIYGLPRCARRTREWTCPTRSHDLLQGVAMKYPLIPTALLAASLVACQANPVSGRQQLVLVSEEQTQVSSAQAYTQTLSEAQKKGKLSTDAALNSRVKRITDRLIVQAGNMYAPSREWQWSVAVIDDPSPNAWCMPGGK